MRLSKVILLNIMLLFILNIQPVQSTNAIVITITLPDWMKQIWGEDIFSDFERLHPGVKVVIVPPIITETAYSPAYDLESYLDYVTNSATNSDIFFLHHLNFQTEAINANLFLDLKPLIDIDTEINESAFYPAIWNSFVWNNGVWGLPIGANFWGLIYRPSTFDDANLAYPNGNWTLDDFTIAVSSLEDKDRLLPGFSYVTVDELKLLFRSLADVNFYDDVAISQPADLVQPSIVQTLDSFSQLSTNGFARNIALQLDLIDSIPMWVGPLSLLTTPQNEGVLAGSPLPGDHIGVRATGFAISRGTAHPEIAYELVKYIVTKPEVVSINLYESPALRSITYDITEGKASIQSLVEIGREEGLSFQNMHYADYVFYAYNQFVNEDSNLISTLEEFQQSAITNTHLAETYTTFASITVNTPSYLPQDNHKILNLSIWSPISPLPNLDAWQSFLDQYTNRLPNVDFISLSTNLPTVGDEASVDCAISLIDYDISPFLSQNQFLDVKPLAVVDRQFPIEGYLQPIEHHIKSEATLYNVPIAIHPIVLWRDVEFNHESTNETLAELLERQIYLDHFDDAAIIDLRLNSLHDFLLLASILRVSLFDFSTSPPEIDLDNPAVLEIFDQLLSLINKGVITSNWLSRPSVNGELPLFFSDTLDITSSHFRNFWYSNDGYGYQPLPFASDFGTHYISFGMSEGYVYSNSTYPDECYSLFRELSLHPDLYYGLPASYLSIEHLDLPQNMRTLFDEYASMLEDPNTVILPYKLSVELNWLEEAIAQAYENDDLLLQLQTVTTRIQDYRSCMADLGESISVQERSNLCANN